MFDFFKKKPVPEPGPVGAAAALYPLLFGDVPLAEWGATAIDHEPGASFHRAVGGTPAEVRAALEAVLAQPDLESRHHLQAWTHLRQLGVTPPPATASQVLGVVVEVALDDGNDVVAAYADHSARYLNQRGAAIVWDVPGDAQIDGLIDDLLAAGQAVVPHIGPWTQPRLAPPGAGLARVSFLTPAGLHFGQGPTSVFFTDPMAGPVLNAALALMQALMAKAASSPRR